jgi:hypothetical protein
MSDNDRFIGQLEDYLDAYAGDAPLPAHVRDAIRAALPGTRQVRSGWGPRRMITMFSNLSTPVRGGLVAATLVVVVALGATVVANSPGTAGTPGPSAAPTASASASPARSPEPSVSSGITGPTPISMAKPAPCAEGGEGNDCIAAGTYALNSTTIPGKVVVTVPVGWFSYEPGAGAMGLLVDSGPDAPSGSGWGPMIAGVSEVRRDPCDPGAGVFAAGEIDTPEEVAAAMATWPGFTVTEPAAITLAGAPGVQVDVSATGDLGSCVTPATWSTDIGMWIDAYPMADADTATRQPATFRILDVGDELLVVRTQATIATSPHEASQGVAPDPDRHAAHKVQQDAILDSIQLGGVAAP